MVYHGMAKGAGSPGARYLRPKAVDRVGLRALPGRPLSCNLHGRLGSIPGFAIDAPGTQTLYVDRVGV